MNTNGFVHTTEVIFEGYAYLTTGADAFFRGCKRCGGTGHYSFNGFDSICYECNNDSSARLGVFVGDEKAAAKDAHRRFKARAAGQAKKEAARMVFIHKMEAKQAAVKAADAGVFAAVEASDNDDKCSSFMRSMHENLFFAIEANRPFTENMIAAVRKSIDAKAEKDANAVPVPVTDKRMAITGIIVSAKYVENDFGGAYKILVEDDLGFRVYGSLASSLQEVFYNEFYDQDGNNRIDDGKAVWLEIVKGRRVTFMAKVEASRDDKAFGFFTRPTKAELAE